MLRRISARYSRGFLAALLAVAALVTVANVGPARAAVPGAHPVERGALPAVR
ncbi:hypothetical protein AB0912_28955 [Streptomyces sp. NPDC007084]|uniref:hypothetical protein n=1 Tax=Streptomyces sp. NPDC007084 TaxID=3154313 RepID=UPI0034566668